MREAVSRVIDGRPHGGAFQIAYTRMDGNEDQARRPQSENK